VDGAVRIVWVAAAMRHDAATWLRRSTGARAPTAPGPDHEFDLFRRERPAGRASRS
jgi:hypothetical protein